jgi:hypothetical protein
VEVSPIPSDYRARMADVVTHVDLARELELHEHVLRSHLREYFTGQGVDVVPDELLRPQADAFLAWHATRFGTAG